MLKISQGSNEILESIRQGHVAYIINTREIGEPESESDGLKIRRCATENNATIFTSLDTVRVLLDVLEETTLTISTINS
jgi:carbamoyl-phosphate synthase large subunit